MSIDSPIPSNTRSELTARAHRRVAWVVTLAMMAALTACSEIPALDDITVFDDIIVFEDLGLGDTSDEAASPSIPDGVHEGLSDELITELAADGFEVDRTAMADLPCHAMFDIIMGDCTEDDVRRVADDARELRTDTDELARPIESADYVPGSNDPDIEVHARQPSTILDLADGARISMAAQVIDWEVDGTPVRGYGYNAQVPGPLLKVQQGDTIFVDFSNEIDMPTTIHWHGLRHDNAHDGVPGVTQPAIGPGGIWEYTLNFPDAGAYWYHPHVREDIQQDAGMYGVMVVEPRNPRYYNDVDREEVIILDDLFVENGAPVAYGNEHANFAIMGRFGSSMLINGKTNYSIAVDQGEVVRFHVANVANVRPFRLSFDGAPMRLVGSDLGKYVIEDFVESVLIAPAERYTVEVLFDEGRNYRILNETPERQYLLGAVRVSPGSHDGGEHADIFGKRRFNPEVLLDVEQFREHFDREPDAEIQIDVEVDGLILSERRTSLSDDDGNSDDHDGDDHGAVEWEDDMLAANRQSFGSTDVRWIIRDVESGAENRDLAYAYEIGDVVKMRWFNDPDSVHPMQHPIHIHGQRFLITAIDDEPVPDKDLVWKDTFLMPIGATMDIVMEVTNPGAWMVHCHIAEHLETGMMYQFIVTQ